MTAVRQVGRSEAPCEQQAVAVGDRQVEMLGEVDEELAARARAARLDEAQVLGRQVRVQRQLHLREPPLGAPEADELTDGLRLPLGLDGHRPTVAPDQIGSITSDVTGERPLHIGGNRHAAVRRRLLPARATISKEATEMSEPNVPPETRTTKAGQLAERYTAVWMEPDADRRRRMIAELWSEDAIHILQPTQEVYEAADERAVNPTWQVRGHDELEARVTSAYEDFVATGQMTFRSRDGAKRLGDVVTWRWEGVSPVGEVLGAGLEFVILAADGRIATDYQFVE